MRWTVTYADGSTVEYNNLSAVFAARRPHARGIVFGVALACLFDALEMFIGGAL